MGAVCLGWVLALTPAAGPLGEAAKKELAALEGNWALVRFERRGTVPEADRPVLTIKGSKWSMPDLGGDFEVIAIDPTADPKLIDLRGPSNDGKTRDREGIYKVDGDTLTVVAYARADKKRPTTFDTPTDPGVNLHVYKRVKK